MAPLCPVRSRVTPASQGAASVANRGHESKVVPPDTAMVQLAGAPFLSGTLPSRTAVKNSESSLSFAVAKKSRVPLAEIDARGKEAASKLGRVFAASTGRPTQASTFNSAL